MSHFKRAKVIAALCGSLVVSAPLFGQGVNVLAPPKPAATHTSCPLAGRPINDVHMAMNVLDSRYKNAPKVGELAPEFALPLLGQDQLLTLKELHAEKPVVLFFSSYGCDAFRESLGGLQNMYHTYKSEVNFVLVYVREAHSKSAEFGRALGRVEDPVTDAQRHEAAKLMHARLRVPFPTILVDRVDDEVAVRWAAWPTRAFVINPDGKIQYAGAQGPFGYRPFKGYAHHIDFDRMANDPDFNQDSVEEYLERRFKSAGEPN